MFVIHFVNDYFPNSVLHNPAFPDGTLAPRRKLPVCPDRIVIEVTFFSIVALDHPLISRMEWY